MVRKKAADRDDVRVIDSTPDVFGVPIRAGDFILHTVTFGRSAVFGVSRVVEVRERLVTRLGCRGKWTPQLATEKLTGQKATIHHVDRVVRAPDGWTPPPGSINHLAKR